MTELNDTVAGKPCALAVLLSSTPSRETWKRAHDLIVAGDDVTWRGVSRETLLHLAVSCCQSNSYVDYVLPVVYQLADAGVDVDAVDVAGNTALHVCALCSVGHQMAIALTRIGVVADCRNDAGQTAADIALEQGQQSVVTVIEAAGSGLWRAVMDGDQATAKKLMESLWFRFDLRRDGTNLLTAARAKHRVPDSLMRTISERSQYVRLMHSALAGNADVVRQQLQYFDSRVLERQLQDSQYRLQDGTVTTWPLLAQVLQLCLTDVARVLIEHSNVDVNVMIVVDGGRKVPLFQWTVEEIPWFIEGFQWAAEGFQLAVKGFHWAVEGFQ